MDKKRNARPKAIVSWSSGKDAASALAAIRARGEYDVVGLVTTVRETDRRIPIHGVHESLVKAQADALNLPVDIVELPLACPNAEYEARLGRALRRHADDGATHVVFGDLFLADIRGYREQWLASLGLRALFPLWGMDTKRLASQLIRDGYRATIVSVDSRQLAVDFAGRDFDGKLLADLPPSADPCGENGEFHTFVLDAPGFRRALRLSRTETVDEGPFRQARMELAR